MRPGAVVVVDHDLRLDGRQMLGEVAEVIDPGPVQRGRRAGVGDPWRDERVQVTGVAAVVLRDRVPGRQPLVAGEGNEARRAAVDAVAFGHVVAVPAVRQGQVDPDHARLAAARIGGVGDLDRHLAAAARDFVRGDGRRVRPRQARQRQPGQRRARPGGCYLYRSRSRRSRRRGRCHRREQGRGYRDSRDRSSDQQRASTRSHAPARPPDPHSCISLTRSLRCCPGAASAASRSEPVSSHGVACLASCRWSAWPLALFGSADAQDDARGPCISRQCRFHSRAASVASRWPRMVSMPSLPGWRPKPQYMATPKSFR